MDSDEGMTAASPYILIAFLFSVMAAIFAIAPNEEALGWAAGAFGFFMISLFFLAKPKIGLILLLAFALRTIVALLGHYALGLPDSTADAFRFDAVAYGISQSGWSSVLDQFTAGSYFFAWSVGVIYWILGYSSLLGLFVNVFFGTGVVLNGYLLAKEFRDERSALITALLLAVFPVLLLYSSVFLREAGWVYFFTLALLLFVRWHERPARVLYLGGALAITLLTGMFHSYAAIAFAAMVLFAMVRLVRYGVTSPENRMVALLAGGILGGFVLAVFLSGLGLGKINLLSLGFDWLVNLQQEATRGRAAFPEFLIVSSWPDLVWKGPLRIAYLLFTPFPWMIETSLDWIGAFDAFLYLFIVVLLVVYAKPLVRDPRWLQLMVILALLLVVVSLTVGNYGTALRHRGKLVTLMIVLLPTERFSWPVVSRLKEVWTNLTRKTSAIHHPTIQQDPGASVSRPGNPETKALIRKMEGPE